MRIRRWIGTVIAGCVLAGALASARAQESGAKAGPRPLLDYIGRGSIQVTMPEATVGIGFEQSYIAPDTLLFAFDMNLLRQWTLISGDRERSYTPGMSYVVERRFKNLEKLPSNPSVAVQLSMAQFGRVIQELPQLQELGIETVLGQECRIVRVPNQALFLNLQGKGLVGDQARQQMSKGITKAWLTQAHGLPVRIVIHSNEGSPAIQIAFTELKINSGLKAADLKMPLPSGVALIPVTIDVTAPGWEEAAEKEVERQVAALQKVPQKGRGGR